MVKKKLNTQPTAEIDNQSYFLPYQIDWLNDTGQIKVWEKSRRIGATYVQAFEDVNDVVLGNVPAVWFSSADESAAKEYILYCAQWAKLFDKGARDLGEQVLESDKSIKTFTIEFTNGRRINALSSNPKAFRSKGGKVVLDEFAFHNDAVALWKAAKPVITWGFPLRILSTHKGKQSLFYKFVESIKSGKLNWSLHTTTIFDAVEQGLVDKIYKRKTTKEEREAWLQEQEENSFDRTTWLEEYCCTPVDEATAFLSYEQIFSIEREGILDNVGEGLALPGKNIYIGVDIGRKKDLTVLWIAEEVEKFLFTRKVIELERTPFKSQKEILFTYLSLPGFRRACIDATGLGMQLAEEAQDRFGRYRVEPITFTGKVKEELAYNLLRMVEDRQIFIPPDKNIREDLHSVRKITTASNNIRFDVQQSEVSGHADRFWALALCCYAAKNNAGITFAKSKIKRESYKLIENFT
ncbi:terminase family protein [Ignavibacterium sp.]|uniref:phage terminase large subunit family protein n=1 Tax=Ignavibacterium sp. TaxID=2651167 RepID=UPI0025C5D2A1|nr:terminase family protein [Ignavibacterium sp.]